MEEKYNGEALVLALGFFDGVHLGHRKIIEATMKAAQEKGIRSGVMTFIEHPLKAIFPAYSPWLITTNEEKIALLSSIGVDTIFLNNFNEALMKYSPEAFVKEYLLSQYNVAEVVVGFNYSFGYKGEGNVDLLKKLGETYGFSVTVVPPCTIHKQVVSSTFIRELISSGRVEDVETYLGRKYRISGTIVRGKGLGHTYNIPTANLKMKEKLILPSSGVYYTKVELEGKYYDGLTNLGFNPTFEKHPYSIETYIYDFDGQIYGEGMALTFLKKVRGEMKFESVDALVERIKEDIIFIDDHYRQKR